MKKRSLSFLMTLLLVLSMQAQSVHAAEYLSRSLVKLNAAYYGNSTLAVSNTAKITVNNSYTLKNAKITSVVITSSKSAASKGDITMHVANTTTGYSDSMPWARSITFTGLNGSSPVGNYQIYFTGQRKIAKTTEAATISSATIKICYE